MRIDSFDIIQLSFRALQQNLASEWQRSRDAQAPIPSERRPALMVRDTIVCLLAGGAGERLYPLTRDRAKPAVTFGGIYRIIDITLSNCINSDLRRIYILTQYKALSLNRHIREGWSMWPASSVSSSRSCRL